MDKMKVVLHVDELEKWQLALGNTQNLIKDVGVNNLVIEIVANAAAVKIFSEATVEAALFQQMAELTKVGVQISVCQNALRANAIQEKLLPPFITIIPAGITRIVKQQAAGYAYVKP